MANSLDEIRVYGARQHNLKNIDLTIPKNKIVVFTGVSGSGKSSLAMDTIYAEGQRRYVESLSAYARQFLGVMDKPDVDKIEGLSPAIAIDQKTTSKNPRSTVGTITEIYDFLRLLYARIGHPHCPNCGREISRQSSEQIVESIFDILQSDPLFNAATGVRFYILAPIVKDRKGEFQSLFDSLKKQGIVRVRLDNYVRDLDEKIELIKTNKHSVDAIVGRYIISKKRVSDHQSLADLRSQIFQSVETALRLANGTITLSVIRDESFDFPDTPTIFEDHLYSENFACPVCNISISDIAPRTFSFNSPHGACPACDGLGTQLEVDQNILINPKLSIREGGIFPWANAFDGNTWIGMVLEAVAKEHNFSLDTPIGKLSEEAYNILMLGTEKKYKVHYVTRESNEGDFHAKFEGILQNLKRRHLETKSDYIRNEIEKYMVVEPCPVCNGARLKKESLSVVIDKKNIFEISSTSIEKVYNWTSDLPKVLTEKENLIASSILKEINYRLKFLIDVGLAYLTLGRASSHLSGGEAQRIRLASQIGSGLSGVLYVLDEPSIGLHQKDQAKLISTLKHLRDLGNTVLVVEHDMETMLESDYIFDMGPGAGEHGGEIVSFGTPAQICKDKKSITGQYLSGKKIVGREAEKIFSTFDEGDMPVKHPNGEKIILHKANGHNLKDVTLEVPLGKFVSITGVSGSGKSSLIMDTLLRVLRQEFGLKNDEKPLPYHAIEGIEYIDKVVSIDQSPIGRTPKSNPATYTKAFDHIRDLFSKTEEARIRGYDAGRFSFNVKGGRCEACNGEGQIKIEMQFMPDVYVTCDVCQGKRYNREALEIHYKGKNISDVLDMTVDEALVFFENAPSIKRKIKTISDVGLGYIKLGQPAPTMSGGEAQRVKLASELSRRPTGRTLYILDEPTTGLHFYDLERLIAIFKRLTARGNTVLVIEHNLDIILNSDFVVDLGPHGGDQGGEIVFSGSLHELLKDTKSYTAESLRELLQKVYKNQK